MVIVLARSDTAGLHWQFETRASRPEILEFMNVFSPNQALQATAGRRLGWQVGRQRPAVPELVRRSMRTSIVISTGLGFVLLVLGCHSPSPRTTAPQPPLITTQAPPAVGVTSQTVRWPVPSNLPTFGEPSETSIRVVIFGMRGTVKQPGYYYLPKGSVIRDAVEAAHGLGDFTWWRNYSGLERPTPDGSFEVIRFTRNRSAEEQIVLRDGDRIYFGHEVY